jgi:UDP:flavonoid glycosyltransferase YjiC (YdhE family)
MRVVLSTYGSRGGVEPMAGLAEECDAPVATRVMPTGVGR